jgi:hypothetical protein
MRFILVLSAQAFWRLDDRDASSSRKSGVGYSSSFPNGLPLRWGTSTCGASDFLLRFLEVTLYAGKEVEVVINTSWRYQLRFLDELCWVSLARTLRPLLMTFVAWQRACACGAPRTAILVFVGVAGRGQLCLSCQHLVCWLSPFQELDVVM